MKLEKILEDQLIYDGMDDHFYDPQRIVLDSGEEIVFNVLDGVYLIDLKSDDEILLSVLSKVTDINKREVMSSCFDYRDLKNRAIRLIKIDNYIIVFNAGETQPARYQVNINYIFKICN